MINNTKTECDTKPCQYGTLTRTRFYNGMLLTAEHLRDEQNYHREMLKRLNRHLFGSGIICGLTVENHGTGLCLKVLPGVALDCCGNLIEVCKCIILDLSKECEKMYGSGCQPDPRKPEEYEFKKYLVLRYDEDEFDPQPVLTPVDDCKPAGDKAECQHAKIREGFCLELWDKCPCEAKDPKPAKDLRETLNQVAQQQEQMMAKEQALAQTSIGPPKDFFADLTIPCSPCGCCESAVGLAYLTINCEKKTVTIEYQCRNYVITPRMVHWLWYQRPRRSVPNEIAPLYARAGDRAVANMVTAAIEVDDASADIKLIREEFAKVTGSSKLGKKAPEKKETT